MKHRAFMRNTLVWGGALAAATLMFSACDLPGSSPAPTGATSGSPSTAATAAAAASSAPASTATDGCALVTQDEAAAAMGVAASAPDKQGISCSYHGPAQESVGVIVVSRPDTGAFDRVHQQLQGQAGFQDVPGVADVAFMGSGGGGGQFHCRKGSTALTITLSLGHDGTVADVLMTLGKTACGRL